MFYMFKYWYRRRQRILAARRGRGDVEKSTPLEKLAAALQLKNKGGSSTGSSSSSGTFLVVKQYIAAYLKLAPMSQRMKVSACLTCY